MNNLNAIETEFLKQLDVEKKDNSFAYNGNLLTYLSSVNLPYFELKEKEGLEDGNVSTNVFYDNDCVLNITTINKEKENKKSIRVVRDDMLYSLEETINKKGLNEITITTGTYDTAKKNERFVLKMKFVDKIQPEVFLKTYIMRIDTDKFWPSYIDCTKSKVRLYDCGTDNVREEPVIYSPAREDDYLFLLDEAITYGVFPDGTARKFLLKIMPIYSLIYQNALERFDNKTIKESKPLDFFKALRRRQNALDRNLESMREEMSRRLSDNSLSYREKCAMVSQYNRLMNETSLEGQIEIRTIIEKTEGKTI